MSKMCAHATTDMYLLATSGTNTTVENKYGVYISKSHVQAENTTIAAAYQGRCPLGRPWNELHRSVFMKSYFDSVILPTGYIDWNGGRFSNQTFMATYSNFGPGWDVEAERSSNVTIVLDRSGVAPFASPRDVFVDQKSGLGTVGWIDRNALIS